jgi:hypothetical protein
MFIKLHFNFEILDETLFTDYEKKKIFIEIFKTWYNEKERRMVIMN